MPTTIHKEAWSKLREATNNLDDHNVIKKMMEEALKDKIRLTKKNVARDKLVYLLNNRIGTSRIEALAKQIEGNDKRNPNTVVYIVGKQLKAITTLIDTLKAHIFSRDKNIKRSLPNQWRIDLYLLVCRVETSSVWSKEKHEATRSRKHLLSKYKHTKKSDIVEHGDIRVELSEDLNDEQRSEAENNLEEPVSMGVELTTHEKQFLKLPQNLSDHVAFDRLKVLTDSALMASKYRMTVMSRLQEGISAEQQNAKTPEQKRLDVIEQINATNVYNFEHKTASFSNMRVTSMKTCRRVTIPEHLPEKEEAHIQSLLTSVEEAINREASRNKRMRIKPTTLTKSEALGLKSLKKRTKNGHAAIVATDKSGKLSVLDKLNYDRKVAEHTSRDLIISEQDVVKLEATLSATSSSLARVLKLGDKWNQQDRVQSASKSTLSSVPPLAILLKDHKPGPDKPVRPLCRSAESPNGPLSEITSNVMSIVANELNGRQKTEVKSTEEMCAILDRINESVEPDLTCINQCGVIEQSNLSKHNLTSHPNTLPQIVTGSFDVKALYPSLDINHSSTIIDKLIRESEVNFDCDVLDMALHLAATNTQEQINKMGLSEVVHTRRYKHGARPIIISKSVTGTETERETLDSWIPPTRAPTPLEVKQMLATVISQAVALVMKSHVYTNSDVIWQQLFGGAIGIRATCEVAKLVMLEHDRILWLKVAEAGIIKVDSGRYVDDENPTFEPTPFGARLINGHISIINEHIESDKTIPHDKRTFGLVLQIANSIWENIQFTMEVPSDNESGYIPVLDMQVGINQVGQITRKFYSKPMNTPYTILARSAHSWQTKRATLTQEGVRRMLNTSTNTPQSERNQILTDWDLKMNLSGYNKSFRGNVISSAILIYNQKLLLAQQGGQPVHRPSGWNASERDLNKNINKHTWYHGNGKIANQAPLIIDSTPSGKMESEIRDILAEASKNSNVNIKLVVRGGRKIVKNAPSDPFASRLCSRPQCKVCTSHESMGGCKQASIGYTLTCEPCAESDIVATYQGESSKSAYERGEQHAKGLVKKAEDNPIWKHSELHHNSDNQIGFSMKVTGRFAKPMIRQENEAIRIRESVAVHEMNSRSEFHQPVIIRLIPTSSQSQSDQAGTPSLVMDPRQQSKRKAQHVPRPDSPNVESRSKVRRTSYYARDSPPSRQSRRDQYYHLTTVTTTRQQRNHSSTTTSESYYTSDDNVHVRSTSNNHQSNQSSTTSRQHSRHSSRSSNTHSNTKTNHRAVTPEKVSRNNFQMSPLPLSRDNQHNNYNHTGYTRTVHWADRNPTPPRAHSTVMSPMPVQTPINNHSDNTHEENISLSPVSPDSFSFAMTKLRSKGKFAYRLNNTNNTHNTKTTQNNTNNTNTRSSSDERRHLNMIGAVSRSVMRNHPSTLDNVIPVIEAPLVKKSRTNTVNIDEDLLALSQISQIPLTQAVNELNTNSVVVAQISQRSKTVSTSITSKNTKTIEIPTLPLELSIEFDTSLDDDDFNHTTPPHNSQKESISQLQSRASAALDQVAIRADQVKFALDNPITTLEGLNNLRQRRKREATVSYKPFATISTGACRLSPEKSKSKPKVKNTPKNTKKTLFNKPKSSKTTFPLKKSLK